jgi:hypothetical protein
MQNENTLISKESPSINDERINSKENPENKIQIETPLDLYKIPISVLKNSKIYNFEGKLYEKIYNEALEMEKEIVSKKPPLEKPKKLETPNFNQPEFNNPNYNPQMYNIQFNTPQNYGNNNLINREIRINKIIFEMKYQTQMGQEVGVIGSLEDLGKWNQGKVLKLNWRNGNVWNKEISYVNGTDFEFKFILINHGKVQKWEDGNNRPFIYNNIHLNLKSRNPQNGIIKIWNLNNQTLEFDTRSLVLKIICDWNKK